MKLNKPLVETTFVIATLLLSLLAVLTLPQPVKADTYIAPAAGPLPAGANPNITIATEPYLSVSPNPIGKGQTLLVNMWLHPPINVNHQFLKSFQLEVTDPSGKTTTEGPMDSFAGDSTAWMPYTVNQVGNWTFKFNFLGMWFPAARYYMGEVITTPGNTSGQAMDSAYYKPSTSRAVVVTVQEEQVMSWPSAALPTDYWTRPANAQNRDWWAILGNYPATGIVGGGIYWPADTNKYMANYNYVPYVQGPTTAHVVWKRQNNIGGLIGGTAGQISITLGGLTGTGYPTLVYSGRCYEVISKVNTSTNVAAQNFWRCYDLRTGEIYWERMVIAGETIPTFIEYAKQGEEVPGASARAGVNVYLDAIVGPSGNNSGRILKYDPWTGAISSNITGPDVGITAGTLYGYPNVYSIQTIGSGASVKYRLIQWNVENNGGNWAYGGGGGQTTETNFTKRIKGNVTWPFSSLGTCDFETGVAVTAQSISSNATGAAVAQRLIGVKLSTGDVIWNVTTDPTTGIETFFTSGTAIADHGKYAAKMQNGEVWAWDLNTGKIAWKSPLSSWPWGVFGAYHSQSAYGLLYHNDYNSVNAINWTNGNIEWSFVAPAAPFETPYNDQQAWHGSGVVADGKLYTFTCEHTPSQPLTRGWKLYCIDAISGQNVWNISCGQSIPGSRYIMGAVADGYLAYTNEYDFYLYVYGKGQSKTTIEAPTTAITQGQSLMLRGNVLDQSPAQPGTPCISADSMGGWMEYLHQQQPIPANVTGVPVSLDTVDPNGNTIHIATVTTEMSGTYSYMWKPDLVGQYLVTATFMGDGSYGSSYAQTGIGVVQASSASTPQPTTSAFTMPPFELYFVGTAAAIILAIAIVGLLIIRKKP